MPTVPTVPVQVRLAAAEALEEILILVSQRERMTEYVSLALRQIESATGRGGSASTTSEAVIGSFLILDILSRGHVVSAPELQQVSGVHAQLKQP